LVRRAGGLRRHGWAGLLQAGTYSTLIAAGAVVFERWTHRRTLPIVAVVVVTLVMLPPFLPVVPVPVLVVNPMWSGLAENQLETVGWPEFVDQVAAAYATVPGTDRSNVTILTDNYGEAGAVDRYGPATRTSHRVQRSQRTRTVGATAGGQNHGGGRV